MLRYCGAIALLASFVLIVFASDGNAQRYVFGFHPYFPGYRPGVTYQYRYGAPVFQPTMPQSTPPMIYRPGPRCLYTGSVDQYGNPFVIRR